MSSLRHFSIGGAAIVGALWIAGDAGITLANPPAPALKDIKAVQRLLASWPQEQAMLGTELLLKYGGPADYSDYVVVWTNSGPFSRTILYRYGIDHNFPLPHKDILEQVINYRVPPDKVGELAALSGSITVLRTGGELSVRDNREEDNILWLNLAVEIATGKRTAASARQAVVEATLARLSGETPALMAKLAFAPSTTTVDPDKQAITGDQLKKAAKRKRLREAPARASSLVAPQ